jgi:hypothetical protein
MAFDLDVLVPARRFADRVMAGSLPQGWHQRDADAPRYHSAPQPLCRPCELTQNSVNTGEERAGGQKAQKRAVPPPVAIRLALRRESDQPAGPGFVVCKLSRPTELLERVIQQETHSAPRC